MSGQEFCKNCGKQLEAGSEFCPKCGKAVTQLPLGAGTTPPVAGTGALGGKVGGIDKRVLIAIGVIILILIVPIFPRDKIIYVAGQTATTVSYQSTSYQTSLQAYPTTSQQSIQVYVGTLMYVPSTYYGMYGNYYSGCYRGVYGYIRCGGYYGWPNYNYYTTTITVNPSDNVVKVQDTQQVNGYLSQVVLTKADGSTVTYTDVFNDNLAQTGTSTYQTAVTQTSTVTQSALVATSSVTNVACDNCIPQHVTEHVSLLQLLLGI